MTDEEVSNAIWSIMERMQGKMAAEIRVMLEEGPYEDKIFDEEQRRRRVAAMKDCVLHATSDEARHESWMKMHADNGWVYGETFDPVKKTHPNLLPWYVLPQSTRSKARIFCFAAEAALEAVRIALSRNTVNHDAIQLD